MSWDLPSQSQFSISVRNLEKRTGFPGPKQQRLWLIQRHRAFLALRELLRAGECSLKSSASHSKPSACYQPTWESRCSLLPFSLGPRCSCWVDWMSCVFKSSPSLKIQCKYYLFDSYEFQKVIGGPACSLSGLHQLFRPPLSLSQL